MGLQMIGGIKFVVAYKRLLTFGVPERFKVTLPSTLASVEVITGGAMTVNVTLLLVTLPKGLVTMRL